MALLKLRTGCAWSILLYVLHRRGGLLYGKVYFTYMRQIASAGAYPLSTVHWPVPPSR